jgi:hypothetical protein
LLDLFMVASKHSMFPRDVLEFFKGCSRIGELARARGVLGPDGQPVWSIAHWQAFCRGARAYKHFGMLGAPVFNTVIEVEECIQDGYDEMDIHRILAGYAPAEAVA